MRGSTTLDEGGATANAWYETDDRDPSLTARPSGGRTIHVASFNIQTGISTSSYRDYITGSWRHIWPSTKRLPNLNRIAHLLRPFDLVGLQEVDGGGARSGNIVQTQYLAEHAGFAYWHNQINRRIGTIALHSNGLLSRLRPDHIHDYKLPGRPGRGAMLVCFGREPESALYLCVLHLALGQRARMKQIEFVADLVGKLPNLILMGDLNCEPNSPELRLLTAKTQLADPMLELKTFPSWRPQKMLDHILVTGNLGVTSVRVLNFPCSDHLPIAMEIALPQSVTAADALSQSA